MRIINLKVENYRGIQCAEIKDAGSAVVIAGPNGSGKSCLLDAIRLFKSIYGSYQTSEIELLSNEFQLNWRGPMGLRGLLRDKTTPLRVRGEVAIGDQEKQFMLGDGAWMVRQLIWQTAFPQVPSHQGQPRAITTPDIARANEEVEKRATADMSSLRKELEWNRVIGNITIHADGSGTRHNSVALSVLFGFFVPDRMGIIDYHGSHRKYVREQLRSISLTEADEEETVKSHALYNYETKYANLKSTMASEYVRDLLERDALGMRTGKIKPLAAIMEELFKTFLPGKTFTGPVVAKGGELRFPVRLDDGKEHDINELSSGEKEILFAYLRARTLAPRQSVLLIDEPELHLNPGLVQGLPAFYEKHIGKELDNQIWLVTHSDRFLREAIDTPGMSVYHMQHAQAAVDKNQLSLVPGHSDSDGPFIDHVGELASYRPAGKIVILEGEDSRFDEKVVTRLFPDIAKSLNFVSAGSRTDVHKLQRSLDAMVDRGHLAGPVCCIVDPDGDIWSREPKTDGPRREWDVYHIENYLLNAEFIKLALEDLDLEGWQSRRESTIRRLLEEAAGEMIKDLALRKVRETLDRPLRKAITLSLAPTDDAKKVVEALANAVAEVQAVQNKFTTPEVVETVRARELSRFRAMWENGQWKTHFPGKDILGRFCGRVNRNLQFTQLRTAVVGEMVKHQFQPPGMARVIRSVAEI